MLFINSINARDINSVDYDQVHHWVLQHQFSKVDNELSQIPGYPTEKIYLLHLSEFLKINMSGQNELVNHFKESTSLYLKKLDDRTDRFSKYTTAVVLLQSAFTRGRFGDYMKAGFQFNKAYRIIQRLTEKDPDFMPGIMLKGIMQILFGSVPEDYQWALKLMNVDGDIANGLNAVETAYLYSRNHSENWYIKEESLFFLTFTYRNFKPDKKELKRLHRYYSSTNMRKLVKSYPLIRYSAVGLLKDLGKNERAIAYMDMPYIQKPEVPFYYLDYYKRGLAKLQKLDYTGERQLKMYLSKYPGNIYKKAAIQKLAWLALLKDGKNAYQKTIARVKNYESTISSADKAAQKEFESQKVPNKILLRVRLLFDGGYLQQALKELLSHKPSRAYASVKDGLEFTYRLGRIYDEKGVKSKAKRYYQITINRGAEKKYYFAANSALLLGEIYLDEGNNEKAREHFKKCLKMNPDSYKSSMHQKAKAFLQQLK